MAGRRDATLVVFEEEDQVGSDGDSEDLPMARHPRRLRRRG